ncbi:MAG: DUF4238 domain-containing protein [Gammaproteobacteria bacterium]|nr:DUF4238 domain-containing protein [Gammaproteobacteria bacterium]
MSNKLSQRNHTVSQFLIKNWADEHGKVWVLDKEKKKIFQCSTTKVFVEKNIYTVQDGQNAPKSDEIERSFAKFETQVAPVFRELVEHARVNQPSELSPLDILQIMGFLVLQMWRTPESQNRIIGFDREYFSNIARNQQNFDNHIGDSLITESNIHSDDDLSGYEESNFRAKFAAGELLGQTEEFYDYAMDHGLDCLVISNPRRSILLGSHGCCFIERKIGDKHLFSPPMFPVAPDIVLAFSEHPNKFRRLGHQDSVSEDRFVKELNEATMKYSKRVVAKDKKLLEEYQRY